MLGNGLAEVDSKYSLGITTTTLDSYFVTRIITVQRHASSLSVSLQCRLRLSSRNLH